MDSALVLNKQVTVVNAGFYQLRNISKLKPILSFNPQSVPGVYMTPIDFSLIKKNGFLYLSGIRFCDFSYKIYLYTHKKTGLDSVVLKVCKKNVYKSGLRGQYDPTLK